MKKLIVSLILSASLAATVFTACTNGQSSQGSNMFDYLTTTKSVYGFSAASSAMVISEMQKTPEGATRASTQVTPEGDTTQTMPETTPETTPDGGTTQTAPETTPEDDTTQTMPETTPDDGTSQTTPGQSEAPQTATEGYLSLVESLLSDGGFGMISQTSDRPEYSEKMIVSCKDISGNEVSYIMYYNQLLTESEEDEDEVEETYSIEGVMLIDGAEYAIRGERENETGDGETETQTEFRVTISESRYMLVEQSYESENGGEAEQEFSYKIYDNGRLTERSSFEYELDEDGETEVKMTAYKDGKTDVFYFEKDTVDGREIIRLRVGAGRDAERYVIVAITDENGNVYYEYLDEGEPLPERWQDRDRERDEDCIQQGEGGNREDAGRGSNNAN